MIRITYIDGVCYFCVPISEIKERNKMKRERENICRERENKCEELVEYLKVYSSIVDKIDALITITKTKSVKEITNEQLI